MVRNRPWDTEKLLSNAPRVGPREPRAAAATRRVEGPRAAAAVDRDGPTVLGVLIEGVEEVAAFAARGAAGDGRPMASAGISTLLGVEESAPIGSAHDQYGPSRSDSADERRQSAVGCAPDPRRVAEARVDGLGSDGFQVHAEASAAAVASVANIFSEPRPGSGGLGFLHRTYGDVPGAVCARGAEPQPAAAGAFQCDGASDRGMDVND
jgi:hypothetical protein